jgi:hypothetical protein
VRQLAWLSAVPEPLDSDRTAKLAHDRMTRAERFERFDMRAEMPQTHGGEFLLDYLWSIGPSTFTGMGAAPISYSELLAWQQMSGIDLSPWEAETLRAMSRAYVGESQRALARDCPPPFGDSPYNPNADQALDRFLD